MASDVAPSNDESPLSSSDSAAHWKAFGLIILPWAIAIVLACIFWWPILYGAGFIGGDTYIYYFPLKQFYAEGLAQGEIWFWHPYIGNGVPVLGESQTGVFYPFFLIAYRLFSLDTAYSVVFMIHYVLAYVFTYWFVRALGLNWASSLLGALIFVYGWFPPRSCLEWAIVTGTWMPLIALGSYKWMATGKLRWTWLIAISHAVQLLAGHFHLAFITDITVILIAALYSIPRRSWRETAWRRMTVPLFLACGFLLAAYQVLPTWELRQRSQRAESDFIVDLKYGTLPFGYLAQMITPWSTYPIAEKVVSQYERTNMIEAHFYVGLLTLGLVAALAFLRKGPRPIWPWFVMILVGIFLATGVAVPFLQYVPGFNFFRAPGRYALIAQLAFAVLAAECAERLFPRSFWTHHLLIAVIFVLTYRDLLWVGRQVRYVSIIKPPPIERIPESPVCHLLGPEDRVLAPAGNLLALAGAACVPPYLGMGPAEYYKLWNWDKNVFAGAMEPRPEKLKLLRDTGVTHLLTEVPLPEGWPVENIYAGYDGFLHSVMGRSSFQPYYLYRLSPPVTRAFVRDRLGNRVEGSSVEITEFHPHHIEMKVTSPSAGSLVLTELMYPGWLATMGGEPADALSGDLFRVIEVPAGEHVVRWAYSPRSFYLGVAIAVGSLILFLIATGVTVFLRRGRQG